MKRIACIVLVLLVPVLGFAGHRMALNGLLVSDDETEIFLIRESRLLYRSLNGGESWELLNHRLSSGKISYIKDLQAVGCGQDTLIVSYDIYRGLTSRVAHCKISYDGGETWQEVAAPDLNGDVNQDKKVLKDFYESNRYYIFQKGSLSVSEDIGEDYNMIYENYGMTYFYIVKQSKRTPLELRVFSQLVTSDRGVLVSDDGGANWHIDEKMNSVQMVNSILSSVAAYDNGDYMMIPESDFTGSSYSMEHSGDEFLYYSYDNNEWSFLETVPQGYGSDQYYVIDGGKDILTHVVYGGVYPPLLTEDRAQSFTSLDQLPRCAWAIDNVYQNPRTGIVYLQTFFDGIWRCDPDFMSCEKMETSEYESCKKLEVFENKLIATSMNGIKVETYDIESGEWQDELIQDDVTSDSLHYLEVPFIEHEGNIYSLYRTNDREELKRWITLAKSSDGGVCWEVVNDEYRAETALFKDGRPEYYKDEEGCIITMTYCRSNSEIIGITEDYGESWCEIDLGADDGMAMPTRDAIYMVRRENNQYNIYKSIDRGRNWENLNCIHCVEDVAPYLRYDHVNQDLYCFTNIYAFRYDGERWINSGKTTLNDKNILIEDERSLFVTVNNYCDCIEYRYVDEYDWTELPGDCFSPLEYMRFYDLEYDKWRDCLWLSTNYGIYRVDMDEILDIKNENRKMVPLKSSIISVSPNPFNVQTVINYELHKQGNVVLEVYNVQGKIVKSYDQGFKEAGVYKAVIEGGVCASGTYFVRLCIDGRAAGTEKIMLLK